MEPNTTAAPAADGNTSTPAAPATDDYGFPTTSEMDTEGMSDAELEAFVDKTLGVSPKGGTTNAPTAPVLPTPPAPNADDKTPVPPTPNPNPAPPEPPKPEAEVPEVPKPEAPAEAPELDTSDLWVKVKNADGELVQISLEEGVPDDFQFFSDEQLWFALDSFNEMRQIKAEREAEITKSLEAKAAAESDQKTMQTTTAGWANEIQELIDAGFIEKAAKPPADGKLYTPEEVAADPGLKKTQDVFEYMKAENTERAKNGKPALTSFTAAFVQLKKQADDKEATDRQAQAANLTKQRGAMVGGTSAPVSTDKGYVYKRGSARNIWQVKTDDI